MKRQPKLPGDHQLREAAQMQTKLPLMGHQHPEAGVARGSAHSSASRWQGYIDGSGTSIKSMRLVGRKIVKPLLGRVLQTWAKKISEDVLECSKTEGSHYIVVAKAATRFPHGDPSRWEHSRSCTVAPEPWFVRR
jgi:hypothetical protein